jgi:hypothetical protein
MTSRLRLASDNPLDDFDRYSQQEIIPVGEDVAVLRYTRLDVDEPWLPYLARAIIENIADGPVCVDLRLVRKPGGPPVTPAGLREVPLGRLVRIVERRQVVMRRRGADPNAGWASSSGTQSRADRAAYRRARARRDASERRWLLDDKLLAKVAEVYREGLRLGAHPTARVADYFAIKRGRAARWVKRARETGHLGPAPGRRMQGETTRGDEVSEP